MKLLALLFLSCISFTASIDAQVVSRITGIFPSSGAPAGGTEVTITGTNLLPGCRVGTCPVSVLTVGGNNVVSLEWTDTSIRFITPPHPPGEVEIELRLQSGEILRTTFLFTAGESVPTLSEWALILLAALLMVVGVVRAG